MAGSEESHSTFRTSYWVYCHRHATHLPCVFVLLKLQVTQNSGVTHEPDASANSSHSKGLKHSGRLEVFVPGQLCWDSHKPAPGDPWPPLPPFLYQKNMEAWGQIGLQTAFDWAWMKLLFPFLVSMALQVITGEGL